MTANNDGATWDSNFGTYIRFITQPQDPKKKTQLWTVIADNGSTIGIVKWYGQWRKYCFFPTGDTVFEEVCLKEIAQFIVEKTSEYRNKID